MDKKDQKNRRSSDHNVFSSLSRDVLFDSQLTSVISTFGAYSVILHGCSTVRTSGQSCRSRFVVCSSFVAAGTRYPVFWMCHLNLVFIRYLIIFLNRSRPDYLLCLPLSRICSASQSLPDCRSNSRFHLWDEPF